MKHSALIYVLWVIVPSLQATIAWVMRRRKQDRELTIFFWYLVFHVVQSVVVFAVNGSYAAYFYVYWGTEAIDAFFTLAVLQELFSKFFNQYPALRQLGNTLFRWGTVGMCVLALGAAFLSPGVAAQKAIAGLLVMERSIQFVLCGLLLFLFVSTKILGLRWQRHLFGMALGFGVYASVSLVGAAVAAQFGKEKIVYTVCSTALACAYSIGVFIWAYYFLLVRQEASSSEPPDSSQLQKWNDALAALRNR